MTDFLDITINNSCSRWLGTETNEFFSKHFPNGNTVCFKKGKNSAKLPLLYCAHIDEVRFIVNYIDEEGFLRLSPVGGISSSVIFGRRLKLSFESRLRKDELISIVSFNKHEKPKDVYGVVGAKPKHLLKSSEKEKFPDKNGIWLDIGSKSKKESEIISPLGSEFIFDGLYDYTGEKTEKYPKGGTLFAKAIDDRAGCAVLLKLLSILESQLERDIICAFTDNEEIGCVGGSMLLENIRSFCRENGFRMPEYAVVAESTTAADIPEISGAERVCGLGNGAVVSYMDNGTFYDRKFYNLIMVTAAENGIPVQTKTLISGGNDASAIHKSSGGIITAAISIPTRYLHSGAGIAKISDIEAVYDLTRILISEIP